MYHDLMDLMISPTLKSKFLKVELIIFKPLKLGLHSQKNTILNYYDVASSRLDMEYICFTKNCSCFD